ncbi:MAG: hypothetical protein Q9162_007095 [Coniocarpon cinnabarinum]
MSDSYWPGPDPDSDPNHTLCSGEKMNMLSQCAGVFDPDDFATLSDSEDGGRRHLRRVGGPLYRSNSDLRRKRQQADAVPKQSDCSTAPRKCRRSQHSNDQQTAGPQKLVKDTKVLQNSKEKNKDDLQDTVEAAALKFRCGFFGRQHTQKLNSEPTTKTKEQETSLQRVQRLVQKSSSKWDFRTGDKEYYDDIDPPIDRELLQAMMHG